MIKNSTWYGYIFDPNNSVQGNSMLKEILNGFRASNIPFDYRKVRDNTLNSTIIA